MRIKKSNLGMVVDLSLKSAPARRAVRRVGWWIADRVSCPVIIYWDGRIVVKAHTSRAARRCAGLPVDALEKKLARSYVAAGYLHYERAFPRIEIATLDAASQ